MSAREAGDELRKLSLGRVVDVCNFFLSVAGRLCSRCGRIRVEMELNWSSFIGEVSIGNIDLAIYKLRHRMCCRSIQSWHTFDSVRSPKSSSASRMYWSLLEKNYIVSICWKWYISLHSCAVGEIVCRLSAAATQHKSRRRWFMASLLPFEFHFEFRPTHMWLRHEHAQTEATTTKLHNGPVSYWARRRHVSFCWSRRKAPVVMATPGSEWPREL